MNTFTKLCSVVILVASALIFTACEPDQVGPVSTSSSSVDLMASAADPHPLPDPVCSRIDSIQLMSEDFSLQVNYCPYGPCPSNVPQPDWGFAELLNGEDIMLVNVHLAPGWFAENCNSKMIEIDGMNIDQNGVPHTSSTWVQQAIDPVVNRWQMRIPLAGLPKPCFDVSFKLKVVRLDFFSGIDRNSETTLWGWNSEASNHAATSSAFVTRWCPEACPSNLPAPVDVCLSAYPGLPGQAGCANLVPDVRDAVGTVSYAWNTGATTPSIEVCPTTNASYSVTVTDENGPFRLENYSVKAVDILCTPGNRPSPKVLVCHYPPGNPNNPRTICIDWRAVSAHVAEYRDPSMHPNHGHDSGCRLGPCGADPCSQN